MKGLSIMKKKEIEAKVKEVLDFCPEAHKGFIDVLLIAKKYDFVVGNAILSIDEDGFILVNNKQKIEGLNTNKVIGVNSKLDFPMKRFIIAHELGHYFLKANSGSIYAHREHYVGKSKEENDIDYFAACLLMPEDLFKEKLAEFKQQGLTNGGLINKLVEEFNSPEESVRRRMEEVGLGEELINA